MCQGLARDLLVRSSLPSAPLPSNVAPDSLAEALQGSARIGVPTMTSSMFARHRHRAFIAGAATAALLAAGLVAGPLAQRAGAASGVEPRQ